ncbi:DNA pilot protein [Blackfly microvirus SF02]|uniref:DNA pilot protein n=1 Tax=Blackfly microvirus SF02 TaxID=2576452 RepID=A0A4P8PPU1_9VIRU|nr:DNA pilot protein [Blackfly microvirus SF02]
MDPITGALITGGASLLGSMFGSDTSAKNTQAQIQASQQQQATQNAFTEHMSSTAYQRSSADMKAAGLNPMMMFGSGGPASTPGGSSIQAPMPQNKSPFADLGENVQKAVSTAVSMKTMDEMASRIAQIDADTQVKKAAELSEKKRPALIAAETGVASAREAESRQRKLTEEENTIIARREADKRGYDVPRQKWEAIKYLDLSNVPDSARKSGNIAEWGAGKIGNVISPILGATSSAVGAGRLFNDIWRDRATRHHDTKFYKGGYSSEEWRN